MGNWTLFFVTPSCLRHAIACLALMKSAQRSAIIMVVTLVLARTTSGMIEASATQARETMDAAPLIHHRHGIEGGPHLARPRDVIRAGDVLQQPLVQGCVGGQFCIRGGHAVSRMASNAGSSSSRTQPHSVAQALHPRGLRGNDNAWPAALQDPPRSARGPSTDRQVEATVNRMTRILAGGMDRVEDAGERIMSLGVLEPAAV